MTEVTNQGVEALELQLRNEIIRLNKVVTALMNRAERNASVQSSDFGMFQTAVMLEDKVRGRTQELQEAVRENEKINRALQQAKAQMAVEIDERKNAHLSLEQLSQQQAQALSLLNATLDASPAGVAVFNLHGDLIAHNNNFLQMWQISTELLNAHDLRGLRSYCAAQLMQPELFDHGLSEGSASSSTELLLQDGRVLERHVSPQTMAGVQTGVVFHWSDITGKKRAEAQRLRLAHILERSLNEIYLFDPVTLKFEYANAGALSNLGYELPALRQMTPLDLKLSQDEATFRQLLQPLLAGETEWLVFDSAHQRRDGSLYNVEVHFQFDTMGERPLLLALTLDITERKRAEVLIWQQANFDALTQLPNRNMLQDRMAQEIIKAQRNGTRMAVLFVDLDKFKDINDSFGHGQGDQLLCEASRRIRACLRASDTVARMGGDEFVVLLPDLKKGRLASSVAQSLLERLVQPIDLCGTQAVVSASIGIALYPDDAVTCEGLLKNADQAMYISKTHGRNRFSYFTREMELAAQRRLLLTAQLRQALLLGQFLLYFQPIVEVATGRIQKAEALIRWQHPELGLVSPAEFIPLAEESGLIVPIGDWVLDEAVRWVARWRERFDADFQVSVNKSPLQFLRETKPSASWAQRLSAQGLPGCCVTMEITESSLMDESSEVHAALLSCREAGIEVAIDDFGTGYSSLAYLKRFDIDYVKIDRSFVSNLAPGSSDLALSQAMIVMAHALGLKVVAEGVETEAQFALLAQAGCDYAQGYLFARPMPPEELETLLIARRGACDLAQLAATPNQTV